MRRFIALLALAALGSGCGLARRGTEPAPTPDPGTGEVGSGVVLPEDATEPQELTEDTQQDVEAAPDGEARFVLTIEDQNGGNPQHVPVQVRGPAPQTVTSDERGQVGIAGPPGEYSFQVPVGCFDPVFVTFGGSGRGAIVPGQVTRGTLRADWMHRFAPGPPVFASTGPDWPTGHPVELRFTVQDRCREGDRAPNGTFPTFTFRPGPNLRIVSEPGRQADGNGHATIRISCTQAGQAELFVDDSRNPTDTVELVAYENSYGGRPSCK